MTEKSEIKMKNGGNEPSARPEMAAGQPADLSQ